MQQAAELSARHALTGLATRRVTQRVPRSLQRVSARHGGAAAGSAPACG